MSLSARSDPSEISQGGPPQETEGGAGDTDGEPSAIWQKLSSGVTEEVCARLPLAHMAQAALVSKSWASTYASSVATHREQLKALAPASAVSAIRAWLRALRYEPGRGFSFPDQSLENSTHGKIKFGRCGDFIMGNHKWTMKMHRHNGVTFWTCVAQSQGALCLTCQPVIHNDPNLEVTVEVVLRKSENLPWVLGLLLIVAQEVVPQMRPTSPEAGEPLSPVCVRVYCDLDCATGWKDWAAIAGLCGFIRFLKRETGLFKIDLDAWQRAGTGGFHAARYPCCSKVAYGPTSGRTFRCTGITRGLLGRPDPVEALHIMAPCWET